jgi:hypothetical protein
LTEPNDQYLCIVPARGAASSDSVTGKAFLLAEDCNIKDPTILRQVS